MSNPDYPKTPLVPPKPQFPKQPGAPDWKSKPKGGPVAVAALIVSGLFFALKPSEGGRILKPYLDSAGIPTACMGVIGPEVTRRYKAGLKFTDAECETMERTYLNKMVGRMQSCVPAKVQNDMTYGEWISYGHWDYNTGAFCSSSVGRNLTAGNHVEACKSMGKYTYITLHGVKRNCRDPDMKRICGGLVTRRDLEVNSCLNSL